ncbi:unnamed protein product [Caenorhabditis angaria]|uniref:Ferric reductase NAD binding domain-containing protein n=1 Tax=Caenorhabditis angaria TaxID=860376 RepID=A0A9P1IJL0_9PELO|nr:unnamed protein product [Caenorhabditis angaria]
MEKLNIASLCRFSRCSKACWEEATSSKNYYLRVRVMENKKNFLISISTEYPYKWTYELDFVAETPTTTNVTYKRQNSPMPLWKKTENGKLVDVVMNYFKSYLQRYHNTLKGISMLFDKTTTKSKFVKNIKIRNMPTREIRVYYTGLSPKPLAQFIDAWAEGKVHENFNKLQYICEQHFRGTNSGVSMFTGLHAQNHFGRPDFKSIFRWIANRHEDQEEIGVFSCGPNQLNEKISEGCSEANRNHATNLDLVISENAVNLQYDMLCEFDHLRSKFDEYEVGKVRKLGLNLQNRQNIIKLLDGDEMVSEIEYFMTKSYSHT